MTIIRPPDTEYEIQRDLAPYFTVYCRPLPEQYTLPCLLITLVGGSERNMVDSVDFTIDSRAETAGEASEYLRNAIGVLKALYGHYTQINTIGAWGKDPMRPDINMEQARMRVYVHPEKVEVNHK
ncbi:MAG: hypothetical protein HUJ95_02800 [Bacteroidales bacterium]|nr:hypothetical protein [Bacteroidales bacterium]